MAFTSEITLWKTYTTSGSDIQVFWASFNPYINFSNVYWVWDVTNSFNLSWFQHGHEVIASYFWVENDWEWNTEVTVQIRFWGFTYVLWSGTIYNNDWVWRFHYFWIDYDEIRHNGTRYYEILNNTDDSMIDSQSFTISWLNVPDYDNPKDSWYIWVEGNNICYIDGTKSYITPSKGYKHIIKHDGSIWSTWKTPWMVRVDEDNHWKLQYVDSSGIERRTHQWDIQWSPWNNEQAIGNKTPWMIRVSALQWNYWYLTFIAQNGYRYRIMNGEV